MRRESRKFQFDINEACRARIQVNGHTLGLRPDDIFLVSYPKSGNTWLRFLLANLLSRPPQSFQDANNLVPDIHNARTPEMISEVPSPRILKSHFPFDARYPRVIYLVRDPRSVCVSQFFFKKRKGELRPEQRFEMFLDQFLDGFDDGFGDWGNHVTSWMAQDEHSPDRITVRYEDLKADTAACLRRLCAFAGIEASESNLAEAIAHCSMDAMLRIERDTGLGQQLKGQGDLRIPFVRRGSTREWREYFTMSMDARLQNRFSAAMSLTGYA